jgi:hypothetical protein
VLPTLAQCVANSMLAGCESRLPSPAMCLVSPLLPGCPPPPLPAAPAASTPAPPPSADICTIAPNSALCQVLSPPTASQPVKPEQQAANEIIRAVVTSLPKTDVDQFAFPDTTKSAAPGGASASSSGGTSTSASGDDKKSDKSDDKANPDATIDVAKSEPAKKMYCN